MENTEKDDLWNERSKMANELATNQEPKFGQKYVKN